MTSAKIVPPETILDAIKRGDTRRLAVAVKKPDGTVQPLSSYVLRFTAKRSYADADGAAVLTATQGSGITVTDAPNGLAEILVSGTVTATLPPVPVTLVWDLQGTLVSGGEPQTLAWGRLTVLPDVTRTTP